MGGVERDMGKRDKFVIFCLFLYWENLFCAEVRVHAQESENVRESEWFCLAK